jgi:hypothetical protein
MARIASDLAGIAAAKLQTAKDEVIATGDPESISWALDQFRQAEALLRRVIAGGDNSSSRLGAESGAA